MANPVAMALSTGNIKPMGRMGMKVSPDDLVELFHGTTPEGFSSIMSSKKINQPAYFSPRRSVAEDYAMNVGGNEGTVVRVRVPKSALMIDLDLPGGKLLSPKEAAGYLDEPDLTIDDFIKRGYSVGVYDPSSIRFD
jgi:hypothetical protein